MPFVAYSVSDSVSPSVSTLHASVWNPSDPRFKSSLSFRPSPSVSARLGSVCTVIWNCMYSIWPFFESAVLSHDWRYQTPPLVNSEGMTPLFKRS